MLKTGLLALALLLPLPFAALPLFSVVVAGPESPGADAGSVAFEVPIAPGTAELAADASPLGFRLASTPEPACSAAFDGQG